MVFELSTETIVIIASIVGTAAGTLYPYWEKLRENPDIIFEKKFIGTAIVSVIASMALGFSIFPAMLESIEGTTLGLAGIFAMVATASFGINRGSNMMLTRPGTTVVRVRQSKE